MTFAHKQQRFAKHALFSFLLVVSVECHVTTSPFFDLKLPFPAPLYNSMFFMKLQTLFSFNYVWSKDIIINIFFLSLVFRMVESEEEYVDQLEILISCFLRPFKMAASSKNPPCTHEDINSIFLNSETVLFLHQIFLKGLTARMESWPTLVLGTSLGGNIQIR